LRLNDELEADSVRTNAGPFLDPARLREKGNMHWSPGQTKLTSHETRGVQGLLRTDTQAAGTDVLRSGPQHVAGRQGFPDRGYSSVEWRCEANPGKQTSLLHDIASMPFSVMQRYPN